MDAVLKLFCAYQAFKAVVVVKVAIVLSVMFGFRIHGLHMYRQNIILVVLYMSFEEEIYFSMFLRNIFLTCFFFFFLNLQNLPFLRSCPVCSVSCLILSTFRYLWIYTYNIYFFHSGVLLLLLFANLLLLWSIGRVFQPNNEFVHLTLCGCRLFVAPPSLAASFVYKL